MKDNLNTWLKEKANLTASLAAGIIHSDNTRFTHFYSRSFANILKENAWAGLLDMAHIVSRQQLPTRNLRWQFQNAFVYGSVRDDGACALIVTSRNLSEEDAAVLENLMTEFQAL
jgi:hypothetical protein